MKVELCNFSGMKIYPSKGKLYVRGDSKVFRFMSAKAESLFLQRKNPRKISWTVVYRRMHRKGVTEEVAKKRSKKSVKAQRGIVGMDLTKLAALRSTKPEVRAASQQAAIKKAKDAKREKESKKASAPKPAGAPKGPQYSKQGMKGGKGMSGAPKARAGP